MTDDRDRYDIQRLRPIPKRPSEDYHASSQRDEDFELTRMELQDAVNERNELNAKLDSIQSLAAAWRLSRNVARQQDAAALLDVLDREDT